MLRDIHKKMRECTLNDKMMERLQRHKVPEDTAKQILIEFWKSDLVATGIHPDLPAVCYEDTYQDLLWVGVKVIAKPILQENHPKTFIW